MVGKNRLTHWLMGAAVLAAAEFACVAALEFAFTVSAQAQFFGDRPRPQRQGGFFDSLFGPSQRPVFEGEPSQPSDNSRAPSPRKPDSKAEQIAPTTSVVVMGDGMADWLGYGLEDAFSDSPEVAIVRKSHQRSGLLRYDTKGDLDWWHTARDLLNQEKPSYVIMMLGVSDRQNMSGRDLAKEADKKEADKKKTDAAKTDANKTEAAKPEVAKPEADKAAQSKDNAPDKVSD
jgi:hypothetical protein